MTREQRRKAEEKKDQAVAEVLFGMVVLVPLWYWLATFGGH